MGKSNFFLPTSGAKGFGPVAIQRLKRTTARAQIVLPAEKNRLKQRATLFRPGEAFLSYLSHMRKEFRVLWTDSPRRSDSPHAAARGLEHAQDKSDVFRNMTSLQNLTKVGEFDGTTRSSLRSGAFHLASCR